MDRRDFLRGFAAAFAGGVVLSNRAVDVGVRGRRPNIVLVLVDDLGWADISCYGSEYYETPNIDRLASQGMKFTDGYAACAVCSPTRAAVLTGRYPARTGVTDWIHFSGFKGDRNDPDQEGPTEYVGGQNGKVLCPPNPFWMDLDEVTIAEVLADEGYACCHVGKWHLGPDAWYPDRQGFHHNIGGCDYGQPPSYFDPYYRNEERPDIPTLKPRKEGEYLTDREADEAVGFIRDHASGPFFLYMAHYAVHTPIQGRADLVAKYEAKEPTHQDNAAYAAMIESVDHAVGDILAELDALGISDNTLVFFTSDNGGLLNVTSNAPLRQGKGHPYEGGIRVPAIVRWPGVVRPGSVCDEPITSVDYFPTICEAVGADVPEGRTIDGVSLLPLLRQRGRFERDAIFWHFPHYRGSIVPYSIIRQGDYKLIKRYAGKEFELFNLKNDLSEDIDLAAAMPEKVAELSARLDEYLEDSGAKLPKPASG